MRTRRAHAGALATRGGRLAVSEDPRTKALAYLPDGTGLRLDERGRLHHTAGHGPAARLALAVAATLATHPATALAAAADATLGPTIVTGDRMGSVHAFSLGGVRQAAPHSGRVTALTAYGSRVYSGGADGTVRLRGAAAPVARRPYPVVALHAGPGGLAVAWADGLVELHGEDGGVHPFRPGPPVRAVALQERSVYETGEDGKAEHGQGEHAEERPGEGERRQGEHAEERHREGERRQGERVKDRYGRHRHEKGEHAHGEQESGGHRAGAVLTVATPDTLVTLFSR